MARQPKKIKIAPGSELARLLTQVAGIPLLLEKDGELYRLVPTFGKERKDLPLVVSRVYPELAEGNHERPTLRQALRVSGIGLGFVTLI
ncbi:MAG: hypothetical protein HYY02_07605 [Chloroflexi bacterium]|nr:hypothetical protein [Chloroflexota bacterium]